MGTSKTQGSIESSHIGQSGGEYGQILNGLMGAYEYPFITEETDIKKVHYPLDIEDILDGRFIRQQVDDGDFILDRSRCMAYAFHVNTGCFARVFQGDDVSDISCDMMFIRALSAVANLDQFLVMLASHFEEGTILTVFMHWGDGFPNGGSVVINKTILNLAFAKKVDRNCKGVVRAYAEPRAVATCVELDEDMDLEGIFGFEGNFQWHDGGLLCPGIPEEGLVDNRENTGHDAEIQPDLDDREMPQGSDTLSETLALAQLREAWVNVPAGQRIMARKELDNMDIELYHELIFGDADATPTVEGFQKWCDDNVDSRCTEKGIPFTAKAMQYFCRKLDVLLEVADPDLGTLHKCRVEGHIRGVKKARGEDYFKFLVPGNDKEEITATVRLPRITVKSRLDLEPTVAVTPALEK